MLPTIKILFENGALGQVAASADGVLGYLGTGVAVASTFALATPYVIYSLDDLTGKGVTSVNNPSLYKFVSEFYNEAGTGKELWLMCFPDTVKLSDMVATTDTAKAKALINAANGRLRGLIISRAPAAGYTPTITNGLDADVALAVANAQLMATWAIDAKYAPVFCIVEGYAYNGNPADLTDLTQGSNRWVGVVIGDTVASSKNAAMGIIAGRIAKNRVSVNIGRRVDGPISSLTAFIGALAIEKADVESIHNKGYITFIQKTGRSGYFISDDPTAALPTDDYNHLTAVRTIFEAYRIAYDTALNWELDRVPVNADGTMQLPMLKSWEKQMVKAVATGMGDQLSGDVTKNDPGVKCFINPTQNVVSTHKWVVSIKVRPFGYPRYIEIPLGFQAVAN
jgi:hypothetical protein